MRALYSRVWQLREGALQRVERVLRGGGAEDSQREMFRALSRALLRCTQDKVANVFHAALQVRPARVWLLSVGVACWQDLWLCMR